MYSPFACLERRITCTFGNSLVIRLAISKQFILDMELCIKRMPG